MLALQTTLSWDPRVHLWTQASEIRETTVRTNDRDHSVSRCSDGFETHNPVIQYTAHAPTAQPISVSAPRSIRITGPFFPPSFTASLVIEHEST